MTLRIGSLFSGYGGLDIAVSRVYGGDVVWYSEIDKHACTVLADRHPGVPNLGDITAVDWAAVPPIDILTGGYPYQPFSHAGKRAGTNDERHLWPHVRDAIVALRPMVTVLENVDGHRSLGLDVVLGDLAEVGLSARWGVVRAADAGAPHGRKRVFIVVEDPTRRARRAGAGWGLRQPQGAAGLAAPDSDGPAADAAGVGSEPLREDGNQSLRPDRTRGSGERLTADAAGDGRDGRPGEPDTVGGGDPQWVDGQDSASVRDGDGLVDWGKYAPAIRRWESVLGRPAPAPTVPGTNGRPRLSPYLVEWMMGLEPGHVTGHGLKPAACLKMLGNGVVPQQAELALRMLAAADA